MANVPKKIARAGWVPCCTLLSNQYQLQCLHQYNETWSWIHLKCSSVKRTGLVLLYYSSFVLALTFLSLLPYSTFVYSVSVVILNLILSVFIHFPNHLLQYFYFVSLYSSSITPFPAPLFLGGLIPHISDLTVV